MTDLLPTTMASVKKLGVIRLAIFGLLSFLAVAVLPVWTIFAFIWLAKI